MKKIETFKKNSIKCKELAKALLQAVLVPVSILIQQAIDTAVTTGEFTLNWKTVAMAGVGAGVIYIIRKYKAEPKVVITTETNAQAENLTENLKE